MKKQTLLFLFLFSLLAGLGTAAQAGVSRGQMLYASPKTLEDYRTTLESEKQALKKLEETVKETRQEVERLKSGEEKDPVKQDLLEEKLFAEVRHYAMVTGASALKGPGVEVMVDDGTRPLFEGEDINNVLVHDVDLLMILNELKKSGAEALSVNGQRVIESSSVICSGYTVQINGERYARPFVIRAIGDGKRMAGALVAPEGYGTSLKNWGILFQVRLSDDIEIPAYEGGREYRYMTKAKGEEPL